MTPREQMEAWQQAFDSGRHGEALPLIAALVVAYPQEPALHLRHAQTLRELGRFAEARAALAQLLALRPNLVPVLLQCAELEALLGETEACEGSLRRAVSVDPRHAEARIRLASFLCERGDWRQAGYELDQALALDPSSSAARALRERVTRVAEESAARPPRGAAPIEPAKAEAPLRLRIDALPVAPAPVPEASTLEAVPPALPAVELQSLVDAHWASLRQDEDRLAATASLTALLLAWSPAPVLETAPDAPAAPFAEDLAGLGYRLLGGLRETVVLPFAASLVRARLLISADGRVLALQSVVPLPAVTVPEQLWLRLSGRWHRQEILELCSELIEPESAACQALVVSNNLGGQVPFQDLPPVQVQRFNRRARPKALDVLHRERIDRLRDEMGGRCLPLADRSAAEALIQRLHEQRRAGRQRLDLLRDEELQRFLGHHYARVAGRVYRQLEALQRQVQERLAAQASRASEPA